jgi:hypothetical protein
MANTIGNTIMNYSLLWPGSTDGVASGSTAEKAGAGKNAVGGPVPASPAAADSGQGWLPAGMGENIDLMV